MTRDTSADNSGGGSANSIAYQGIAGAFSHLACRRFYEDYRSISCRTFSDAFSSVVRGEVSFALIPIENTLGGRVAEIHHLLSETSLYIIGEHFMPICHNLLGVEGSRLSDLRRVISHPQALAQCRVLLESLGVEVQPHLDTAGSAREVSERGDKTLGALSSSFAAEVYGLTVLKDRVEDKLGNTTRFIKMGCNKASLSSAEAEGELVLTSLLFRTRSVPAALYKALGGFATNGVNLVRLESYVRYDSSVAEFYIEVEGHVDSLSVRNALEEMQLFSNRVRILGSYRAADERKTRDER